MKKILIVMSAAAGLAFAGCRPQNPDVPAVREFIRDNWHTTVQHCTADTATLIGLPYPYTVPTAGAMFREMYYWDTFFTNEGLVRDGHPELAKGNTDNLLYMVRRFGKVYNGSRTYYEARSQTPYLSMICLLYTSQLHPLRLLPAPRHPRDLRTHDPGRGRRQHEHAPRLGRRHLRRRLLL